MEISSSWILVLALYGCFAFFAAGISSQQVGSSDSPNPILKYLERFGYIEKSSSLGDRAVSLSGPSSSNSRSARSRQVEDAVKKFQIVANLPVTGVADNATADFIKSTPRCGNSDENLIKALIAKTSPSTTRTTTTTARTTQFESRNYILAAKFGWQKTQLTYRLNVTSVPDSIRSVVTSNFRSIANQWANASGLSIRPADLDDDTADINIKWARRSHGDDLAFDGPGGVLGHAYFPNSQLQGEIHFDADETWSNVPSSTVRSLMHVALHEMGHSLGLDHSGDNRAVMYPYFPGFATKVAAELTDDDRDGIKMLYPPPSNNNNGATTTTKTTPTTTTNVQSGNRVASLLPAGGEMPTTLAITTTTTTRPVTTTTIRRTSTQPISDRRSCSFLRSQPLQAVTNLFGLGDAFFFVVDHQIYRTDGETKQGPLPVASVFKFGPSPANGPISSLLSLSVAPGIKNSEVYIFQKNMFWLYDVYRTLADVPLQISKQSIAFFPGSVGFPNEMALVIQAGYPKKAYDSPLGSGATNNSSSTVVFQLASDNQIYFVSSTHFWTWSQLPGLPIYGRSNQPQPLSLHPILRSLPVRPPQLVAAMMLDDKNYFFAENGSYWVWLQPSNSPTASVQAGSDYSEYWQSEVDTDGTTADGVWLRAQSTSSLLFGC